MIDHWMRHTWDSFRRAANTILAYNKHMRVELCGHLAQHQRDQQRFASVVKPQHFEHRRRHIPQHRTDRK